jgi:rod shape-determining protein MreD
VTSDASLVRRALAAVILAVALLAAVVIQLTVVNRLPLPGATAPDLVLLLVAAIAVCTSPATGAVTGFAGGLALDVAPPAAHYAGEYALVFCLVGYAAARVVQVIWNMTGERDPVTTFAVMAAAAAAGEAGKAALGMLLSDPEVTTAAVTRVLPGAVLYDLLLAPLAYWLVARVTRGATAWGAAAERAPATEFSGVGQLAPGFSQQVFRQASAGAAPNLRLAGSGQSYGSPPLARRVPKLRLSDTSAATSPRTSAAAPFGTPLSLAGGRTPKLHLAANRAGRVARPALRTPGKNWLRSAASPVIPAAKRAPRSPSRGWLSPAGSGGLGGGRSGGLAAGRRRGLAGTGLPGSVMRGSAFSGASRKGGSRSAGSAIAGHPGRSAEDALAARSAPSGLSALSGAGTPLAGGRTPQAGGLRAARGPSALPRKRRTPRSGWLGSASRPRTVIGSGVRGRGGTFRRGGNARGNWYAASPSGAWLRRSRHPWRKRSQRLLRLVGVGR